MAERDLGHAMRLRVGIQRAAPQPRAQRTHRLAGRNHPADHRIGVLLDDIERHPQPAQVGRQHMGGKVGLFLVQVNRHQAERHRRLALQLQQHVQQGVAVLAAGQADHDLVAGCDHAEIGNRLADLALQAFAQAQLFALQPLARVARCGVGQGLRQRQDSGHKPAIVAAGGWQATGLAARGGGTPTRSPCDALDVDAAAARTAAMAGRCRPVAWTWCPAAVAR